MRAGVLYALATFIIWGFFPLYWKQLDNINPIQLSTHRIIWSFLTLLLFIFATKQWTTFKEAAFTRWNFAIYSASAVLIFSNWLLFIYAVNSNHVIETSLGYFINPLLNVLLGVIFLKERLRLGQWLSLAIATAGVLVVAIAYGHFPWIAILLALTLGLYGLVKKKAPLNSLHGLTLETAILFIPSLAYLIVVHGEGDGAFLQVDAVQNVLMVLAGIVTIIPLLCFSSAAQRIPLSLLGVLQYICPSIQFLVGIFMYHEPFSTSKLVGFILVWIALVVFTCESIWWHRSTKTLNEAEVSIDMVQVATPHATSFVAMNERV